MASFSSPKMMDAFIANNLYINKLIYTHPYNISSIYLLMKSHYFTSKSFKYLGNRIQNESPIQGHKTVRSDFEDKIDLLRVPVYDKKKKFQKNNSKKQIQPH